MGIMMRFSGGGGPCFEDRIIKNFFIPFFYGFIQNNTRIHIIGSGIYGDDVSDKAIYEKKFSDDSIKFLKTIENNGGTFGCRDELSWRVMRNNGFLNVYIMGCPAWYDFNFLDETKVRTGKNIRKIVISDPGVTKEPGEQEIRARQAVDVIECVRELFPDAHLYFTFNNGIKTKYSYKCNELIKAYLDRVGIGYYDLSYDASKFSIYDDADLHVGFRVHSHIYVLSRRIPSILIEEDVRGYGMNETFGLPHLLSFDYDERRGKGIYMPNKNITKKLTDVISYNLETRFERYEGVFRIMKNMYYENYQRWLSKVKSGL